MFNLENKLPIEVLVELNWKLEDLMDYLDYMKDLNEFSKLPFDIIQRLSLIRALADTVNKSL